MQLGLHFGDPLLELGIQLCRALLQFRIETCEVQLVELTQLAPIGRIHLIEPLHELVRQLVAELLVELAGQLRRHRHRALLLESAIV